MSTKEVGMHENIISILESKMEDVSQKIEVNVQNSINKFNSEEIPNDGESCQNHVRNLRKNALGHYETVKTWISVYISSCINEEVDVKPLRILQEKREQIMRLKIEKEEAEENQRRVLLEIDLPDYEKFQLYDDPNNDKDASKISKTIEKTYKNYVKNRNQKIIIGIIVTLLCAAADFNIIYALFQASNFTVTSSIVTGIIVVVVLDIPPFVLGIIQKRRDDNIRLWRLRGEKEGLSNDTKRYDSIIRILSCVIFVILFVYILVRFLLFLGGGNFDLAFHAVIERNFQFQDSVFSSADILSAFAPLGTSAVALAVGVMLYSSYTDYVKKAIVRINKELDDADTECEGQISSCVNKINNLNTEVFEIKRKIWAYYMGEKNCPQKDEDFLKQVVKAFQDANIPLYQHTYRRCVSLLAKKAELELHDINERIAPNVVNINDILSMPISKEESARLNELGVNGQSTYADIKEIENQISKLTAKFDKELT